MNMRQGKAKTRPTASEGFIVVAVLWLVAALATFASIYASYVIDTAAAFRIYDDRLRAEALVSGAVELVVYRLTSKAERHPTHGQFSFRLGQADVAVEFRSEASRIDLNAAPKQLLVGLLAALGARRGDAEIYADRIIAWRTAPVQGQDSEASAYQAVRPRYAPRRAPFPNTGELALVLGLPMELVERTLPLVTVYSGLGKVDVLEAATEVIAALPEMTPDRLNAFLAQRQATPADGQALLPLLGRAQAYAGTEASKASRVTVRIAFDDGLLTGSEVVILLYESGSAPYSILSWRDQLDEARANDGLRTAPR
jgi:general secretion pathway protein K